MQLKKAENDNSGPSKRSSAEGMDYANTASKWKLVIRHKNHPTEILTNEAIKKLMSAMYDNLDSCAEAIQVSKTSIKHRKIFLDAQDEKSKE